MKKLMLIVLFCLGQTGCELLQPADVGSFFGHPANTPTTAPATQPEKENK